MRLLKFSSAGEFELTKDLVGKNLPTEPYAILSHTWGADDEEVTFRDIASGTGNDKLGYEKIRSCGEQAKHDGINYFWVDTCCIDKTNLVELSEAINSMFRWYANAAKCYVYLSDVSRPGLADAGEQYANWQWQVEFRQSLWFTRGWTLQELLAPRLVEFFSKERTKLGDKENLLRHICEITGIPSKALRGDPLEGFSITERLSWQELRETTREEDKAYSLLGIFDVSMPLVYGEGKEKAYRRLRVEIDAASRGTKHDEFTIPFSLSRVPAIHDFVSREEELEEMRTALRSDGSRQAVTLQGLGGIGKTQLAIAYAKRYRDSHSAFFWFNIKDEDSIKQSFVAVAMQVLNENPSASYLCSVDTKNLDDVVYGVKAWLSLPNNTRWLAVYDNYDNPQSPKSSHSGTVDIGKFLPEAYQGSIIITTRVLQVAVGYQIRMKKLADLHDSLQILSSTSKRKNLASNPDAIRLVEQLDGFPLALASAGACLSQTSIILKDYLRLYQQSWSELQLISPSLESYGDRTLQSTWQISFDQVKEQNEDSANLLRLWAYFDNQDVWFELLREIRHEDSEWLYNLTRDEINFHNAMRVLCNHGLADAASSEDLLESSGYSIHSCIHSWTANVLNGNGDRDLARLALSCVALHSQSGDAANKWALQRRLLLHAVKCASMITSDMLDDAVTPWALDRLGSLLVGQWKLKEAEQIFKRALAGKETAFGLDDLSMLNNLGGVYMQQGEYDAAERAYMRALSGRQDALGPDHVLVLYSSANLGRLYSERGKLEAAQRLVERALAGQEQALGPNNLSTIYTLHNLGVVYGRQNKPKAAERVFQQVLARIEELRGPEDLWTLDVIQDLGVMYLRQDQLGEAERMFDRALAGYMKVYGSDSATVSVKKVAENLVWLYIMQGRLSEAERMCEKVVADRAIILGPDHPDLKWPRDVLLKLQSKGLHTPPAVDHSRKGNADRLVNVGIQNHGTQTSHHTGRDPTTEQASRKRDTVRGLISRLTLR